MNTPIADFVYNYNKEDFSRFHMPGHKGRNILGIEEYDITEIDGADVLYSADGIINESENNASALFGTAHSYYSAEGSTLAIKAMLSLVCSECESQPLILAARNVHKAFIYAAALIDFDVEWMYGEKEDHLCKCTLTPEKVKEHIDSCKEKPAAVYITSPDYLGNVADIKGIAEVCDGYDVPLLVDNAHGAYLAFCRDNIHPINLGASMCCDSAHKTLPCLTGGAYLHISEKAERFCGNARRHLSLYASTSPSYLILQSLDLCNRYIDEKIRDDISDTSEKVRKLKSDLEKQGFAAFHNEPLKLTLDCNSYGYEGTEIHSQLLKHKICCEYYDRQYIVFMFSPFNSDEDFARLYECLSHTEKRDAVKPTLLGISQKNETALSIRNAVFSKSKATDIHSARGKICADPSVSCPPAVPIVVSGEIITEEHIKAMEYYGIEKISIVL